MTVAVDAQGAEKARPYLEAAGATCTALVDENNQLSQLLNFKAVPNGMLINEDGVLHYQKLGGFDIRKPEHAELTEAWLNDASPEWLAERMQEDPRGGPEHQAAIAHFQRGVALYKKGKVEEALAEWKEGRDLEPDNWVVRKQIWALENPDKFYSGDINTSWQKDQIQQGI